MIRASLLALLSLTACTSMPRPTSTPPLTLPESSDYHKTSSHADVMDFLRQVRMAGDSRVVVTNFGTTPEGRVLPLVIVANPTVHNAEEARASGKPVIYVQANIHAGEVEGKEACLELLRDVVWGGPEAEPWPVKDLIVLIAPMYNPDGNDRFGPKNRPLQHGPDTAGQRPNAAGLDLNRDALKLESGEARAQAELFGAWDPLLFVDLHTTDGSPHGYELTYAAPLNPCTHPEILRVENEEWLPELRSRMRTDGFETFDYGNFLAEDGAFREDVDTVSGWRSFDHRPRFGTNMYGLRNRFAILSEAYSYADFKTRIAASKAFVSEILRLCAERRDQLLQTCRRADQETVEQAQAGELQQFATAELVSRGTEPLLLRGFKDLPNPTTGEVERVADGERSTVQIPCFVRFDGKDPVTAPRAYLIPPAANGFDPALIVENLHRHGVRVEVLSEPRDTDVAVFWVKDTGTVAEEYQGHHERTASFVVHVDRRTMPKGTLRVPMDQPLGRLVFQLLDPRADDGFREWNFYDDALSKGAGARAPVYGEP
jgi:hypothetical protein